MNWFPTPEESKKFTVYGHPLEDPHTKASTVSKAIAGPHSVSTPVDNSCMDQSTVPPGGPKTFDCRRFVIESTDATWHAGGSWAKTEEAIHKYFAEDWQSVRAFGSIINGREGLASFMKEWLKGFPDVFIYVSDLFCEGNDDIGYKTTMPYVLTATNTGPSVYGPATGKKVKYHGLANCYIKKIDGRWQYTNEWDVPDMWSFLVQLNVSIDSLKHPTQDLMNIDECKPLFEWGGKMNWFPSPEESRRFRSYGHPVRKPLFEWGGKMNWFPSPEESRRFRSYGHPVQGPRPEAKLVVASMLAAGEAAHWTFASVPDAEAKLGPYFTKDFVYDFIYPFNKTTGVAGWVKPGGEMHEWSSGYPSAYFTKFLSAGDAQAVTVAAYADAKWTGHFAGLPPSHKVIKIADIDYYLIEDGVIKVNWCLIDVVSMLQQSGYKLLPEGKLPDLGYMPPNNMDALPAPQDEFVFEADTKLARAVVEEALKDDFLGEGSAESWADQMVWNGPPGVGTARSREEYVEGFLRPLRASFSNFSMSTDVLVCQGFYCGAHVRLNVTHDGMWLGQTATQKRVSLRMGLHWRVGKSGKIEQGWCVIDLLEAFAQLGVDLLAKARSQLPSEPIVI
eukprot:CAMPEP_0197708776 /NCGR_PEP_ID=MMETSP1338-20131121/128122_1 /TAXON_ID=43686 ORGANISM="Pelagodinium beii, Strain RCC1491" /NCGR_SAMPLE_ID=MMETSP1338 /ASSEMBLY_ACC=CAM_ASM_000754 /LENGTH=616 /DNA_ID=CAMNT_0043292707 /DNA_START=33 /DNA_END=1883 /DNA_ORIENTATION=+